MKADIVVTWVHEPKGVRQFCPEKYNRYRNLHTFRFALRSWLRFLPWIRKIWVVSEQNPCWLNCSGSNIEIVRHEDFWPAHLKSRDLPTFNSQAIESHLHRIRGLSERFIYFNDDMLVGKTLAPGNFFQGNQPVLSKLPQGLRINFKNTPHTLMLDHGPYAMTKHIIDEVQSYWPAWFDEHSKDRCRKRLSPPFWVYQWYAAATSQVSQYTSQRVAFLCCDETPLAQKRFYKRVLDSPPAIIVLNDDFKDPSWIQPMHMFMETYYGMRHASAESYDNCNLHVTQNATLDSMGIGHIGEGSLNYSLGPLIGSDSPFRVVLFNAMRGSAHDFHCQMLKTHKDLRNAHVVLLNEVDMGMARTRNDNVDAVFAKCLHMNYVYGAEFHERTLGQPHEREKLRRNALNAQALHGNMILSRYPLRDEILLRLPGTSTYRGQGSFDGEIRDGNRNAIIASVPMQCNDRTEWIDIVCTHLDAGDKYNRASALKIHAELQRRGRTVRIIGGDIGSHRRTANSSVFEGLEYSVADNHARPSGVSEDWLFSNGAMHDLKVTRAHALGSDHNFVSATFSSPVCSDQQPAA